MRQRTVLAKRFVPYSERVRRFYPAANVYIDDSGTMTFCIAANNGTGNVLASSMLSEGDAWRRAWTAIEAQRP